MKPPNIHLIAALVVASLTLVAHGQNLDLTINRTTGQIDWVAGSEITNYGGDGMTLFSSFHGALPNLPTTISSPLLSYSGNGTHTGVGFAFSADGTRITDIGLGIAPTNTSQPPSFYGSSFDGTPEGPSVPVFTTGNISQFTSLNVGDYILTPWTLSGWNGGIEVQVLPGPKVVTIGSVSPTNQTVVSGSQVLLTVSASGTPPLSYQWLFGTNTIAIGVTNSSLILTNVQTSHSGIYTVIVTNSVSSVTSPPMTLSVLPAMDFHLVPTIGVQGDLGSTYLIDYINSVGPTNSWTPLATVAVTNRPQYYCDLSAIGQPARLYRLVQLP